MPRSARSPLARGTRLASVIAGSLLVAALSAPTVLAKEAVEVTLAAPLPADAEPGSTVTAVFVLTAISDDGETPLRGSPVFIRLYGPTGAMTEASGVEDRTPGTYRATIEIPAGGAARAEFGIHGSATDASGKTVPSDLIWPYDGILVAAGVPPAVDPGAFQLPGSKPALDPAAGAAVGAAGPMAEGQGSEGGAATPPQLDPRPSIATGLALLATVAVAIGIGRRRRVGGPAA